LIINKLYFDMVKNIFLSLIILMMSLLYIPVFSQTEGQTEKDTTLLGLPGDNLDLYATLDLFQKSKTIEDFEKSLNLESTGINNLDLDLDGKVDFIKVVTKQDGKDFTFVLQDAVSKDEIQDVAVILVSKDKNDKVTMQIVGDKDLYGEGYIVEPKTTTTPAVTPNPGYTGKEPVPVTAPATTTTVVVETTPIVQYVYSPVYVPYVPPYYYGYYPPYFAAFSVMAVGIYCHNHSYYHGGYGYHGNTTVIVNHNNYNNYNNTRNSSNTVNHNNANGNYNRNNASTRPSGGGSASNRPSGGASASTQPAKGAGAGGGTRQSPSASTQPAKGSGAGAGTRQSPSASTQPSKGSGAGAGTRQSPSASTRESSGAGAGAGASTRQSGSNYSSQPSRSSSDASRTRSSGGGSYSGGGASRSGGGYSGGGASRGGGGGGGGGGRRR
jgi:hypothetical protein